MGICNNCNHKLVCHYYDKTAEECNHFQDKEKCVEVVRCKHCVSFGVYKCTGNGYCRHYKGLVDPKPYNFCSYGERRDDDGI